MRLSTVFELLLIFLLIAFAAYGRVIDRDEATSLRSVTRAAQGNLGVSIMSLKQATENLNKYCTCDNDVCQCCRDFHIPVVSLKGPGCASIRYFEKDNLELQLSFGGNLLTSTVVNGKKPRTICVPMPGGYSKFCGRIYSVERESDSNFKACLGLELQSSYEVEASLRLSCFSFGPEGLKLRPAEAFPPTVLSETEDDDDEDDDDDDDDLGSLFDFSDESDNKKDINQLPSKNTAVAGASQPADEEEEDDDEDDDEYYSLGLEALLDIITGDDETEKKKPAAVSSSPLTVPVINKPTPKPIVAHATTKAPKIRPETPTTEAAIAGVVSLASEESSTKISLKNTTEVSEEETTEAITESPSASESSTDINLADTSDSNKTLEAAASDDNKQVVKVQKVPVIKKIIVGVTDKKTSITSNSVNAIKNDVKKPLVKPAKPDPVPVSTPSADHQNSDSEDDDDVDLEDDDDDDEDLLSAAVDDDDDEEEEAENNEDEEDDNVELGTSSTEGVNKRPGNDDHEEVSDEDLLDDDDDDDDDEEASLMSAIIDDEDDKKKKKNKVVTSTEASKKADFGISDILDRKITRRGRQSKIMRL